MRRSILLVALVGVLAATVAGQQPTYDNEGLPRPEVTSLKARNISSSLRAIQEYEKVLKDLGDPTMKQPNESTDAYLQRVDRIFKARALYVHKLHDELQVALEARFAAEAYLGEYEAWFDRTAALLNVRPEQYKKDSIELQKRGQDIGKDICVLATLIKDEAGSGDADLAKQMDRYINAEVLKNLPDRGEREARYRPLDLGAKRKKLAELEGTLRDIAFEVNILSKTAIPEAQAFKDILPAEHGKALKDLKTLLTEKKDDLMALEDRAAQVAILAKYAGNDLALVRPQLAGGAELAAHFAKIRAAGPVVQDAMDRYFDVVTRKEGALRLGTDVKDLIGDLNAPKLPDPVIKDK